MYNIDLCNIGQACYYSSYQLFTKNSYICGNLYTSVLATQSVIGPGLMFLHNIRKTTNIVVLKN